MAPCKPARSSCRNLGRQTRRRIGTRGVTEHARDVRQVRRTGPEVRQQKVIVAPFSSGHGAAAMRSAATDGGNRLWTDRVLSDLG